MNDAGLRMTRWATGVGASDTSDRTADGWKFLSGQASLRLAKEKESLVCGFDLRVDAHVSQ
jgi:hypothetical protein